MILQRTALYPQMRLDVPDARAIEAYGQNDWVYFLKGVMASKSQIISGFEITNYPNIFTVPGVLLSQNNVSLLHPEATTQAAGYYVSSGTEADFRLVLSSNNSTTTTNFVEVDMSVTTGSPDVRAFWDAGANGGLGAEFTDTVDTVINLNLAIDVNISGFTSGRIPLYKIITNTDGTVNSVTDCRPMFFRLGSGGTSPNPDAEYSFPNLPDAAHARMDTPVTVSAATTSNLPFQGADKNIKNFKNWMDAVMTLIKESNATPNWLAKPQTTLAGAYQNAALTLLQGGVYTHLGLADTVISSTATTVTTSGDIAFDTSADTFKIGTTTFNYTAYNQSNGKFTGVSPNPTSLATAGAIVKQGPVGHLEMTGGSVIVRMGQTNSTSQPFSDVDLTTNDTLFAILSSDGTLVSYNMGQDGTSPIIPQDISTVTATSITVATGGNYKTAGGALLIHGQKFAYTAYNAGTGLFTGVSPDPTGLLLVGDTVFQENLSGTGYYHAATAGRLPGLTANGASEGAERTFWIAHFDGVDTMFVRDAVLVPGESASAGSLGSDQLFQYIGSSGAADNFPIYDVNSIPNGTNLTHAIADAYKIIETPIYDEKIPSASSPLSIASYLPGSVVDGPTLFGSVEQEQSQGFITTVSGTANFGKVQLRSIGSPDFPIVAEIRADASGLPGSLLAVSTPIEASTIAGTFAPITFTFPTIGLQNATTYHLVIRSRATAVTHDAGNDIILGKVVGNPYAGTPSLSINSGASWTAQSGYDLYFEVSGVTGYVSGDVIFLPINSKTSTSAAYTMGTDELQVYENGIMLQKGYDYDELTTNSIQLLRDVFPGTYIRFRIASVGGAGAAAGGGGAGLALQDAYANGRTVTVASAQPIVINGPSGQKLLHVAGDVQIDGLLDPTGITFTAQASNPIPMGQMGFWIDSSTNEIHFTRNDGTTLPMGALLETMAGDAPNFTRSMKNNTGATIAAGTPVYMSATNEIGLCDADDTDKSKFFGMTSATAADQAMVDVIFSGVVPGVMTGSGLSTNTRVWISSTPGLFSDMPPTSPGSFQVQIGLVCGNDLILQIQNYGEVV